jgi:hypothetical protein
MPSDPTLNGAGRLPFSRTATLSPSTTGMLCPGTSDVHLLGDCESTIDFNPEVTDSVLDFPMAQQKLHRSKVAGTPVDEGRLQS